MARLNPLTSIKDLTSGALKVPKTVADKAVDGLGKVTGVVTSLVPGGKPAAPSAVGTGEAKSPAAPAKVHGDPLSTSAATPKAKKAPAAKPPVAKTPAAKAPVAKAPAAKAPVAKTPVAKTPVAKAPVAKTPVAKTPAAKTPAAKTPAVKKPAAKKPVAKDSPSGKLPATKAPAKKAAEQKSSDHQPKPVNIVEELGLDPAPVSEAKPAGAKTAGEVTATPADVAAVVAEAAPDAPQGDRPPSPS